MSDVRIISKMLVLKGDNLICAGNSNRIREDMYPSLKSVNLINNPATKPKDKNLYLTGLFLGI